MPSKFFNRKNILYFLFLFLFILVCLEIFGKIYLTKILEKSPNPKFRFNSYRIYEHIPNFTEGKDGKDWIKINGQGFRRMTEVALKKPTNTFRVFFMGGSAAHGISSSPPYPLRHIYMNETIDYYLEKILKEKHPDKNIEVINAAVTGYVVNQHTAYIMEELLNYNPDLFIFFDGINDHFINNPAYDYFKNNRYQYWKFRLQNPSLKGLVDYAVLWFSKYSAFFKGLYAWKLNRDADKNIYTIALRIETKNDAELIDDYNITSKKGYLRSVEINLGILKNFNIKTMVILQPILALRNYGLLSKEEASFLRKDPDQRTMYPYVVSDLKNLTSKYEVAFVDMNPVFDYPLYKEKQLFIDHVHLTPLGGEVVAKTIFPQIDSLYSEHFPKMN
ncbi:MAG: SGNH/GDSL hydrolase family protein [Bacteroidia bacterium]